MEKSVILECHGWNSPGPRLRDYHVVRPKQSRACVSHIVVQQLELCPSPADRLWEVVDENLTTGTLAWATYGCSICIAIFIERIDVSICRRGLSAVVRA